MFMTKEEIADLEYDLYCKGGSPFISVSLNDMMDKCFSACVKGHVKAMYVIGTYYFYGNNALEKNVDCAIYMWKLAAEKGSVRAKMALAFHHVEVAAFDKRC
jgi:TPR repeat protein